MKLPFILVIVFVVCIAFPSAAQLQWVKYDGTLPANTTMGGQENGSDLAVCRAFYNGGLHAGKVVGANCNIGWGGQEFVVPAFEVLINIGNTRIAWVPLVNSVIPPLAVEAGVEEGKRNFVGQATRTEDGSVHPGKVFGESGVEVICNYGYGGAEITERSNFKILTVPGLSWVAYDGTIPANVVNGGSENGKKLGVCRASYEGALHPGKVVGTNCNIGWGGKEVVVPAFELLVNGGASLSWAPFKGVIPKGAVQADTEKGKPLYIGQVTRPDGSVHSGKILGELGAYIFNYGYGGKELTVKTNFRILVQRQPGR